MDASAFFAQQLINDEPQQIIDQSSINHGWIGEFRSINLPTKTQGGRAASEQDLALFQHSSSQTLRSGPTVTTMRYTETLRRRGSGRSARAGPASWEVADSVCIFVTHRRRRRCCCRFS